jgi:adenine deaminase
VPASQFESPRRELTPGDLASLLRRRRVIGLAEMMNFPGVISGAATELAKLELAQHVDGHAPGVLGRSLQAYAAAGIRSDHEAYSVEEGRERLRAGMWLLVREGSAARNLQALLPLLAEYGPSRIAFCTDDREPEHIADDGHINSMSRSAFPPHTHSSRRPRARRTGTGWTSSARSRPGTAPTCSSCPTSRASCPTSC